MFRDKAQSVGLRSRRTACWCWRMAGQRCMSGTAHSSCIAIICSPFGAGAAQMAFDALKKKLSAEGLFARRAQTPAAAYAAVYRAGHIQDRCGIAGCASTSSRRRWPMVKLLLAPVSVQGHRKRKRASWMASAAWMQTRARTMILVTRGGGSKEDLWVFNSERIARAAYAC